MKKLALVFRQSLFVLAAICIALTIGGLARAQSASTVTLSEQEKLEQDFTDPLTTLPQLLVRDSYSPANYGPCAALACPRNAQTNEVIIRPLIPRIPPNAFLPFTQLVRPTFALVTVPNSRGGT